MMTSDQLIDRAAQLFQVDQGLILSPCRAAPVVDARYAVAWALRRNGWSLDAIGLVLDRDDTTIGYGLDVVRHRVRFDKGYLGKLDQLRVKVDPPARGGVPTTNWRAQMARLEARVAELEAVLLDQARRRAA